MENRRNGKRADQSQSPPASHASSQPPSAPPQDLFQVTASSFSLPKGGGAVCGRGEELAANQVTCTGSMTVPIAPSLGRSGFGPHLSLPYDSGLGNGPFGFDWNLSLPQVTRKIEKDLPNYLNGHGQAANIGMSMLLGAEVCSKRLPMMHAEANMVSMKSTRGHASPISSPLVSVRIRLETRRFWHASTIGPIKRIQLAVFGDRSQILPERGDQNGS